jgi:hypothetical protein
VKQVFPEAWGKSPNTSRLMHGVGIRSIGKLMDRIMASINPSDENAQALVVKELRLIAPVCRWTNGVWEELDGLKWDEILTTNRHYSLLYNFLIRQYLIKKNAI